MSDARPLTFTEEARRRQIVGCTVELMAEVGYGSTSLSAIAARAGISKAAVLYHFSSKDNVVQAALTHVIDAFVATVGAAVAAAPDATGRVVGYLRGALGHLRDHPAHVRVLVEGLRGERTDARRWRAVAGILEEGQRAGELGTFDTRVMALIVGGALDGVVAEWISDPAFDLDGAGRELERAVLRAIRPES